jgi:CheY-like chemotaxis protein
VSTILLVSADGELRRLAAAELAKGGHHGLFSADPLEAVRLLAAGSVHAAIIDMELPEPGGEALIARIRADGQSVSLPVLAVLRRGAYPGRARGADRWLARPLGKMAMGEAVLKLMAALQGHRSPGADAAGPGIGGRSEEVAQLCRALSKTVSVLAGHIETVLTRHQDLPGDVQRRLQEMAQAAGKLSELVGIAAGQGRGRV